MRDISLMASSYLAGIFTLAIILGLYPHRLFWLVGLFGALGIVAAELLQKKFQ